MPTTLWTGDRWQIALPDRPLTTAHLIIIDRAPDAPLTLPAASDLINTYRRIRSALWSTQGCRGYQLSFAVGWTPDQTGIGEPDPSAEHGRVIHVFGRGGSDPTSPMRVMALPRPQRSTAEIDSRGSTALATAIEAASDVDVAGPDDHECDGCAAEVLTDQERWRADGVRVIRPHQVMIDSQVLVLPLRHVVSVGGLRADEVVSMAARLAEVRHQFSLASAVTGLSCFVNDGTAARQETPHVHLHVMGRSRNEAANPFALLGARLGFQRTAVDTER